MKSLTVMLTAAMVLCMSASALAQDAATFQDVRSPDTVTPPSGAATVTFQDVRAPDNVTPSTEATPATFQDVRAPDNVTPANLHERTQARFQELRSPDSVTPMVPGAAPVAASSDVTLPDEGGLGVLLIVLISLGGVIALGGVAFATTRVVHAHHGHSAA